MAIKQEKFQTGMYIIDDTYRIVNVNQALLELYPAIQVGEYCYRALALQEEPCEICPLRADNALFYNPLRKEWIFANAAEIDYPGHGTCYNVQFQIRQRLTDVNSEALQTENMDEHIMELSGGTLDVCILGGYCEVGSPLSYANEQMLRLLGYGDVDELSRDIDGLVSNAIHPDDLERVTKELTRCAMNGGNVEAAYRIRRKDRTWFWVVTRGKRVETKNGMYALLFVVTDMSEFMQRQEEMRKQNEQLLQKELNSRAVLEHMPGGYHRCANAPGWPFLYISASFEEITGWKKEEIEQEFGSCFVNMVLEEDIPLCAGIIAALETKGYSNTIYRLKKKGGGYTWVSDSTMRVCLGEDCFYHGVLADVSEQIEALEKAKKEAENSSLAKSTFLFNASHDIRTPMNAIQGFAHIIDVNTTQEQPVVKDAVRKLIQSSKTLMTLINDVLDLSRIERGKEYVDEQPMNMLEHATKLYEMFAEEMAEAGISFVMEQEIHHPHVLGDDLKLTRIAMNILSNAKKFTPAGGSVTFGIQERNYNGETAEYFLSVQDTGIGMSKEFQKRAFEQFERERSSTESGITGSGLGLAIIKKFSELMHGSCQIESEIGQGTKVTVSAVLKVAQGAVQENAQAAMTMNVSGKRLLLVEDNDFNREIARYVFENVGFKVEEAENGVICLEKLLEAPAGYFDLVLMDIQMPVMDGYKATQEIRRLKDPKIAQIPIIAMTANAFDEDRKKCIDVGMDGHIGKPLEAKTVRMEIKRVLSL